MVHSQLPGRSFWNPRGLTPLPLHILNKPLPEQFPTPTPAPPPYNQHPIISTGSIHRVDGTQKPTSVTVVPSQNS